MMADHVVNGSETTRFIGQQLEAAFEYVLHPIRSTEPGHDKIIAAEAELEAAVAPRAFDRHLCTP
jgi:hypothetical protein